MESRHVADAPAVLDVSVLAALRDAEGKIYVLRGLKVMLAQDLAALYGVETRVLLQAMRRNLDRFPADFAFTLENHDLEVLRSQLVISKPEKPGSGGARYRSVAFTEQGVAMLSSVLRSDRAVAVNVEIMRAFVRMRQVLASHADLARKLEALEKKYDTQFKAVFDAIRELMTPPPTLPRGRFGFARDRSD